MTMKVSAEALSAIREQVERKDKAALALGVALAEYEIEKLRLRTATMTKDEKFLRLGAVQSEFDGYRDTHMRIVIGANAAQKAIGEAALAALGLHEIGRDFTIDTKTGDVLELKDGAYVQVEAP